MENKPAMWHPGDRAVYLYKGPHGWSLNPERFPCVIEGTTKMGRVRIRATCPKTGEFTAVVKPESLRQPENGEQQPCE